MDKTIIRAERHGDNSSTVTYSDGTTAILPPDDPGLDAWLAAGNPWLVAAPTLDDLKARAVAEIISYADGVTAKITSQYPASEVASWPAQLIEARMAVNGMAMPAPSVLQAIVDASNGALTMATLAASVIKKATAYNQIVALVQALRVQAQTQIAAITDPSQIDVVVETLLAHSKNTLNGS